MSKSKKFNLLLFSIFLIVLVVATFISYNHDLDSRILAPSYDFIVKN